MTKEKEDRTDNYPTWSHQHITPDVWLKLPVNIDVVCGLIRQLSLEHTNVIWASNDTLAKNPRPIFGLIALCGNKLEFDEAKPIDADIEYRLFSKNRIKNAELTLDLLNIKLGNNNPEFKGIAQELMAAIEPICNKGTDEAVTDPSIFLHYILHVAYAHNYIAWLNKSKVKDGELQHQHVYSFTIQKDGEILYINEDGFLVEFAQSNMDIPKFVEFLRTNGATDVLALIHDDTDALLKEFYRLTEKIRILPSPMRNTILEMTHGGSSLNFDFDALAEISSISEELDETDEYELIIENQEGKQVNEIKPRPSMSPNRLQQTEKEREQCEKRIKELSQILAARKKEFPHFGWNIYKLQDRSLDPIFQDFCVFYRKKTSPVAALLTPKLKSSKRSPKVSRAKDSIVSTPKGRPREATELPETPQTNTEDNDALSIDDNDENLDISSQKSSQIGKESDPKVEETQQVSSGLRRSARQRSVKIEIPVESPIKETKKIAKEGSTQKRARTAITISSDSVTPKRLRNEEE